MYSTIITGVGSYVPETVVTNSDLAKIMDTSDEWITERTGIKERHFFKEGVDTVSGMGLKATQKALKKAGLKAEDIDMIIFATLSPDYFFPGSGVLLQTQLGLKNIPALDIRQQCAGFIYGISIADQYIKNGVYKNILLVGSEIQSGMLELTNRDRNVSVIFGDGAGAIILSRNDKTNGRGVLSTHIHSDGAFAEKLMMEHPGSRLKQRLTPEMLSDGSMLPKMEGQYVFKHAIQRMPESVMEALDQNHLTTSDINLLIPHQANLRIAEVVQKTLNLRSDQVFNNIQKYGNTTAASIPLALTEAMEEGRVKEGDLVCFTAFGSGFVWGSALIRW